MLFTLKTALLVLFLSCCFGLESRAAAEDSIQTIKPKRKLSLTPFPALFSSPETGFGFGALVVPVYNFGNDSLTRSSTGQLLVYYTTKKQTSAQLSYTIYTNRERFAILGETNYFDAPIFYYGTGNRNSEADKSLISYKLLLTQNRVLKQLKKNVFLGGQFQVINVGKAEFNAEEGLLDERPADELNGYTAVGLGPAFLFDSRDNSINAYQGSYVEIGSFLNGKSLGSAFNFTRHTVDVRKYYPLSANQVFAVQAKGIFETGDVPYRELAYFGGHRNLRGFYEGRYRDKQLLQTQAEYRLHFAKRHGAVLFAGLGEVGEKLQDFELENSKFGYGIGYRFMLNTTDKVNIRIDYAIKGSYQAFAGGMSGLYFAIGETF
ncbi:BamA/TamA family outer membrane protein [Adhaeribacter sp. BT258]|uniref:BamA/TamA family outer membrane protein n=1 Tax=Adhaeribacter terrigena TaxID=2793070 RepID=A0ABS1C550_9BACT|nr:BamA/TamA family outer membrane protein [Adhaeribacter terrigena]MBK0404517.1 BamA/TamA family outer membrane protein [Adhaeribacter terrigena]